MAGRKQEVAMRVLIQAGHSAAYPPYAQGGGGAPGEAAWAGECAALVAKRLRDAGCVVALVGDFLTTPPPALVREDYDLFLSFHYDAAVYGAGRNTGGFADRARGDPMAGESDRALRAWEAVYFPNTGLRNATERRNPNTWDYYAFRATSPRTPGVILEHGVGSPVPTGGFPPGQDAALLHGQIDLIAALDARAVLDYLGVPLPLPVPPPQPPGPPEEPPSMDEPLLDDAELAHKLMPLLWGEYYTDPTFAIPQRWLQEFRKGNQLGRPRGPEVDVPDVPGARSQEFEDGVVVVYRDGKTSIVG